MILADEDAEGSSDYETTSESGDEYSEEDNAVAGPSGTQTHANGTPALLGDAEDAEDTQVETAIEGDFDRLIQNIRDAGDGSSSGMLNKMWDMDLEEREAEFKDDLREASGVGKMKKKVRFLLGSIYSHPKPTHPCARSQRGRRRGPVLSQQVRALIGEGNQAFVDADLHETVRIMQEVIRIEPRAAAPWSVLAQCYDDWGERMKALQLRIMAAHLNHDPDEWGELAQKSR